jgi:hypothetical protein
MMYHNDYLAAKTGDPAAAVRLVFDIMQGTNADCVMDTLTQQLSNFNNLIFLPVTMRENGTHNMIPLTTSLGWPDNDNLPVTLATVMEKIIHDEDYEYYGGILHHAKGVDLIPANMELSGMEMSLVNAMSREHSRRITGNL